MEALNIRFIQLHLQFQMLEDAELPMHKASAIRGGIGNILIEQHCIRPGSCNKEKFSCKKDCGFAEECIVQRIMRSHFLPECLPKGMSDGDSVGYMVECENTREHFTEGDTFTALLTLFGKNIAYLGLYLQVFSMLGMRGLGKERGCFTITSIRNQYGQELLEDGHIRMDRFKISTVGEYATSRLRKLTEAGKITGLLFKSPTSIKYRGEEITEFCEGAICESLLRRIHILNAFEGRVLEVRPEADFPHISGQTVRTVRVPRYSNRTKTKLRLDGIVGEVQLEEIDREWLLLLCAGEILHVGANTSFGFGRYRIRVEEK